MPGLSFKEGLYRVLHAPCNPCQKHDDHRNLGLLKTKVRIYFRSDVRDRNQAVIAAVLKPSHAFTISPKEIKNQPNQYFLRQSLAASTQRLPHLRPMTLKFLTVLHKLPRSLSNRPQDEIYRQIHLHWQIKSYRNGWICNKPEL